MTEIVSPYITLICFPAEYLSCDYYSDITITLTFLRSMSGHDAQRLSSAFETSKNSSDNPIIDPHAPLHLSYSV